MRGCDPPGGRPIYKLEYIACPARGQATHAIGRHCQRTHQRAAGLLTVADSAANRALCSPVSDGHPATQQRQPNHSEHLLLTTLHLRKTGVLTSYMCRCLQECSRAGGQGGGGGEEAAAARAGGPALPAWQALARRGCDRVCPAGAAVSARQTWQSRCQHPYNDLFG